MKAMNLQVDKLTAQSRFVLLDALTSEHDRVRGEMVAVQASNHLTQVGRDCLEAEWNAIHNEYYRFTTFLMSNNKERFTAWLRRHQN